MELGCDTTAGPKSVLTGIWRRTSLSLRGEKSEEHEEVLWLQLDSTFADLRTPRAHASCPIQAFSGHIDWSPPHITFNRDMDMNASGFDDQAELEVRDNHLIERGSILTGDTRIDYVEIWAREPRPPGKRLVQEWHAVGVCGTRFRTRCVELDGVAIVLVAAPTLGGFGCAEFERDADGWERVRQVGTLTAPSPLECVGASALRAQALAGAAR